MALFKLSEWLVAWLYENNFFSFDWDSGNIEKNENKHGITPKEVEDIFKYGEILPLGKQVRPVVKEDRFGIIGMTKEEKILCIVFTFRDNKVRPISARTASQKERRLYAKNVRQIPKRV